MISNNEDLNNKLLDTLSYHKTIEEEFQELQMVSLGENYLESLGVKVKTDMYGYYRHTYDILKDLGEYLYKKNNT